MTTLIGTGRKLQRIHTLQWAVWWASGEKLLAVEVSIYCSVYLTHQRHSKGKIKRQSQQLNGWKHATIFHVEFVTESTNFHAKMFWPQIYSLPDTTNFDKKHTSQKHENLTRNVMWFLAGGYWVVWGSLVTAEMSKGINWGPFKGKWWILGRK